jgi:hypothetical protein
MKTKNKLTAEQRERVRVAAGIMAEVVDMMHQAADVLDGTVGVVVPRARRRKRA